MSNVFEEFEEDSKDYTQVPTNTELSSVKQLAQKAADLFKDLKLKKSIFEELEKEYNQIVQKDLPAQMSDVGLSELKLEDGTRILVQDLITARFPKDPLEKEQAVRWLEKTGNGSIVSHKVVCEFQKQESEKVLELQHMLENAGVEYNSEQTVHWKTLESVIKSSLQNGEEVPKELFSVYEGKFAKLK